jgi:fermentation-respiration switch protein FrsA (DUF1100 family)
LREPFSFFTQRRKDKEEVLGRFFRNLWGSRRPAWLAARIALLLAAGLVAFVMLFEDRFIYFPTKYPEGAWDMSAASVKIEDVWFRAEDGVRLHGWYCTPRRETDGQALRRMTLLWFHGNAGNVTYRLGVIERLVELPADVFIIDYRGYGRSEGSPSEAGLYADARGAWDYLTVERQIPPADIVVFGDSLGGAVAIELATRVEPAGLIVQSGFTSIRDMAAEVMPFVPGFLLRTKMDSLNKVAGVRAPKLFIHSPADELVPYRFGRQLYDAAPAPKQFYEVKGARHNETDLVGGRAYFEAIANFVRSCAPKP